MPTAYDEVPYPCNAYAQTHPGHLAAIARLHGMNPAAAENCRVLEIGCGDGGNLLPLAYILRRSRFLGIDLAETSIASGQKHARDFGLTNLELQARDLMALQAPELGQWDYIIAHGVFSWVPEGVRLRLLSLCQEVLAPQGVVFVSYNAYPGAHVRHMVRDMLLYHTENAPNPASKIGQGRALMQFLAQNNGTDDDYGTLLRSEAERVLKYDANHFYHDDLADLNQPFYLHQFADLAAAHGLQYLGDADYASMFATRYPPQVREILEGLGDDVVRREQYLDFLKCRRFRQTLLCRGEVKLDRTPAPKVLEELYFASSARVTAEGADLSGTALVDFTGEGGLKLKTSHPVAKLALSYLGSRWPGRATYRGIEESINAAMNESVGGEVLSHILTEFLQMGTAEAHTSPAPFTTAVSERPQTSAWARYQLAFGAGVTNLRHQTLHVQDPAGRWLLGQLDGTRTLEEIANGLAETVKPGADGRLDFAKELDDARGVVRGGTQQLAELGLLLPDPHAVGGDA